MLSASSLRAMTQNEHFSGHDLFLQLNITSDTLLLRFSGGKKT